MTIPGAARLKAAARAEAKVIRDGAHAAAGGVSEAGSRHLLSALTRFHGRIIAGYLPMGSEMDPLPAMTQMAGLADICVPVVMGPNLPLSFRRWTPGAALVPHVFGTMVPESGETLIPEALIVPLLAFDRLGHRLGYGGGYYDRTLAGLRGEGRRVRAIGYAFAAQEMPALPTEEFDARLDLVVTENGLAVSP